MKYPVICRLALTAAAALAVAACSEAPTTTTAALSPRDLSPSLSAAPAPEGTATPIPNSYILVANGNGLPDGLRENIAAAGGEVTGTIPEIGVVRVTSGAPDFKSKAARIDGIRSAVPDVDVEWITDKVADEGIADDAAGSPPNSDDNDRFFNLQWGHDALDVPEAWAAGHRGRGARVSILDSGISIGSPEFNATNLNQALSASFVPGQPFRNTRPPGVFNHGTHVAGIVAAADNGIGTIGVAPEAELVAVKVLSDVSGSGSFFWIAQGIVYAANIDSDIINMSLAGAFFRDGIRGPDGKKIVNANELNELYLVISRATTYAYQQGTTVIAAAANSAIDRDHDTNLLFLPADAPHVIQVAATAPAGWAVSFTANLDEPASYTNYGQSRINFAAPGGDFDYFDTNPTQLCTVRLVTPPNLTRACWVFDGVMSPGSNTLWFWASGTSMATPYVAGVAALIVGKNGGEMHPAEVEAVLRASADDLGKPGKDDFYGAGRVNARRAVQ